MRAIGRYLSIGNSPAQILVELDRLAAPLLSFLSRHLVHLLFPPCPLSCTPSLPITMTDSMDFTSWMERDLFGYGPDRPKITWPNGRNGKPANICINFVINQEEGGERSVDEGDEAAETVLHEFGPVGHVSATMTSPARR